MRIQLLCAESIYYIHLFLNEREINSKTATQNWPIELVALFFLQTPQLSKIISCVVCGVWAEHQPDPITIEI